jgi:hypothetical protein
VRLDVDREFKRHATAGADFESTGFYISRLNFEGVDPQYATELVNGYAQAELKPLVVGLLCLRQAEELRLARGSVFKLTCSNEKQKGMSDRHPKAINGTENSKQTHRQHHQATPKESQAAKKPLLASQPSCRGSQGLANSKSI